MCQYDGQAGYYETNQEYDNGANHINICKKERRCLGLSKCNVCTRRMCVNKR